MTAGPHLGDLDPGLLDLARIQCGMSLGRGSAILPPPAPALPPHRAVGHPRVEGGPRAHRVPVESAEPEYGLLRGPVSVDLVKAEKRSDFEVV